MEKPSENEITNIVKSLEERVSLLERVVGTIASQKGMAASDHTVSVAHATQVQSSPVKPKTSTEIEVGQKWLSVVGVLLIFFAALFFVQYVFQYVGPEGKVLLSYLVAAVLFGISIFTQKKHSQFSGVVGAGAWGVTYLVTYAMYFFPATRIISSAPLAMFLLVVAVGSLIIVALYQKSKSLVSLALVLGVLTVILSPLSLFSIIGIVILLGVLVCIAVVMPWGDFILLATLGAYVSYLFWFYNVLGRLPVQGGGLLEKQMIGLIALVVMWIIVAIGLMMRRDDKDVLVRGQTDSLALLIASGGTAILGLFALKELVIVLDSIRFAKAMWLLLLAIVTGGWSVLAYEVRNKKDIIASGGIVAMILLMSSIAYFLPERSGGTALAWAALGLLIVLGGMTMRSSYFAAISTLPLIASAVRFIASDMQKKVFPVTADFSTNILVGFVLALVIAVSAALLRTIDRTALEPKGAIRLPGLILGVALLVLYAITAQELSGALPSVIWSFVALATVVAGFITHWKDARILGLLGLAITVVRVFIYDLGALDALARVISFAILGGLLLLVGYGYNHNKEKLQKYLLED